MGNLFENVLRDLKDGIDSLVYLYDHPEDESMIWAPTARDMNSIYNQKRSYQIEVLERMIVNSNDKSSFAKKYAGLIIDRFEDLAKYFRDGKPVFSKEHRKKLGKLQSSVNFFYDCCTN